MADPKHLEILKKGVAVWNEWRKNNPGIIPSLKHADLSGADLSEADLSEADLSKAWHKEADLRGADLRGANLSKAILFKENLRGADLKGADLFGVSLRESDLRGANSRDANLSGANLSEANLSGADLSEADLSEASLWGVDLSCANLTDSYLRGALMVETNLKDANLSGPNIYGISAWGVKLNNTKQKDLIINRETKPVITVDNLEVAQFIYLLLHNEKIRDVIDTITSKVVLILGRFTLKRKAVLDAIREELRNRNYLPVLFDFQGSTSRDITETVSTLAHMARFVIADITDARSIPQELKTIVPNLPSLPIQPLLQSSKKEYGMFEHFKRYPWVLAIHRYRDIDDLLATLKEKVIMPAEAKVLEVRSKK